MRNCDSLPCLVSPVDPVFPVFLPSRCWRLSLFAAHCSHETLSPDRFLPSIDSTESHRMRSLLVPPSPCRRSRPAFSSLPLFHACLFLPFRSAMPPPPLPNTSAIQLNSSDSRPSRAPRPARLSPTDPVPASRPSLSSRCFTALRDLPSLLFRPSFMFYA